MRFRILFLAVVALSVCSTGWPQTKSLGEVAGSITLNPEAIVEKQGVVEDPRAAKRADENLLGSVLADCSAVADLLGELVAQVRLPSGNLDLELVKRIESTSFGLETEVHSMSLLRLGEELAPVLETAREAEGICAGAGALVRVQIVQSRVVFDDAAAEVARCQQLLDQAKAELGAVGKPAESPGIPDNAQSLTDDDIITVRCESEREKGPDAFESCQAAQYLSQAAMASRNAGNEMLDEGVFSNIRRMCLDLQPRDFVQRDACEQDKMTAVRLEAK